MDAAILNKSALYKKVLVKGGATFTYLKVSGAIDGLAETLSEKEAKQLIASIDEAVKVVKTNIQKAIETQS